MLPALPATHARLVFPQLHPRLEPYRTLLEESVKPAWRLVCHQVETVSRSTTHIGGFTPYVPDELGWPRCVVCGNPLSFIWQLNFADFGAATFARQGLFQFFYCWLCFPLPGSPYDFDMLCRWFPDFTVDIASTIAQASCPYRDELPPDQLFLNRPYHVELLPFLSVPSAESDDNPLKAEIRAQFVNTEGESFYKLYNDTPGWYLGKCMSQVGGYPDWVQNDDTPHCPICERRAELVGAVGSDDTNLIWGDTGYWYIFACKSTKRCLGLNKLMMVSQCL